MTTPHFARFLALAREHTALIVDLCADPDLLSRAQLLHYLEHHGVPAAQKDALIDKLGQAAILLAEPAGFTVNPAVVDLVNYYERRGRPARALHFGDYDRFGLAIYRRIRAALPQLMLYVPDDLAAPFRDFAGHDLLLGQPSLVARDDDRPELREVAALIAQYNAGLEQEIVRPPAA
jgi:hypothetical protein